jgi:cob(I)alamin adenosyltransferase
MPIYTRAGDTGITSLFGGKKISKADPVLEAYGSIDELNSHIGFLVALEKNKNISRFLQTIQKDLFSMSAYLAGSHQDLTFIDIRVKEMEDFIDNAEKNLPKLFHFILPGGSEHSASVHIARSVCRGAERALVRYDSANPIIRYINRFSDLLFVYARVITKNTHEEESLWLGKKQKQKT